jgi:DNA-binding CsgD family transcriptional regulator
MPQPNMSGATTAAGWVEFQASHHDLAAALRSELTLPPGPRTVFEAARLGGLLARLPGVYAAALDEQGAYLWASESYCELARQPLQALVGRRLDELFAPAWAAERLALARRVVSSRAPIVVIEIFGGKRVEGLLVPVPDAQPRPAVLYVSRFGVPTRAEGSAAHAVEVYHCQSADLGPLTGLTRRELEVLRLIARGLDNGQIAENIARTKRAVEWHVNHLYEHLRVRQRVDLFRLGSEAGLHELADAEWTRLLDSTKPSEDEPAQARTDH